MSFPRKGGTEIFFLGGPKWGVLGGGQKVYVEKVYVLLRSPKNSTRVFSSKLLFFEPPNALVTTKKARVETTPKNTGNEKNTERGIRDLSEAFGTKRFR